MYWFVADEHYGHASIIEYCDRPFAVVNEMNRVMIDNHNEVVGSSDITIHAGDFCWYNKEGAKQLIKMLNGNHVFIKGSHDSWLPQSTKYMWRKTIEGQFIVVCHYAMRSWERSHYGSWQLYGHSHARKEPIGLQYDVGVDNNNFYPVSFDELKEIFKGENYESAIVYN
jgi:calcineurin-like phosphoesterase family protein